MRLSIGTGTAFPLAAVHKIPIAIEGQRTCRRPGGGSSPGLMTQPGNKAEAQARIPLVLKGKDRRLGPCYSPLHRVLSHRRGR
jgi:hypothetical protein